MASLEDLLAEEGFKEDKTKSKSRSRTSFRSEAVSMPLYLCKERKPFFSGPIRPERTRSDVSKLVPRDDLQATRRLKDSYAKDLLEIERFKEQSWKETREKGRYKEKSRNDAEANERYRNKSEKNLLRTESLKDVTWKDFREDESSNGRSRKTLQQENKKLQGLSRRKGPKLEQSVSKLNFEESKENNEPALDQVAIQAVISILSSYIGRFFKDKNFRTSLRANCLSTLGFEDWEEQDHADNGAVANLKQAIDSVERIAEESGNPKDLKKASVQLSVIAGLSSKDLVDCFTPGIPYSHLAACAHLYLSVIYKLQKKDRVSAKHLLQVFCDSSFQARTTLLVELWDYFFLPHLSHLRLWFDQEAVSIQNSSNKLRKMKLLEKVYSEQLDNGTYQFAVYYKEWLKDGIEPPPVPSIHVPSSSVYGVSRGVSNGPSLEQVSSPPGSSFTQPLIRKRLYKAVFGRSDTVNGLDEAEYGEWEGSLVVPSGSFDGAVEDKATRTYSPRVGMGMGQRIQEEPSESIENDSSHHEEGKLLTPEKVWRSPIRDIKELEEDDYIPYWHTISENTALLQTLPHTKVNELTLKKLAKTVFQQHETGPTDSTSTFSPSCSQCSEVPDLDTKDDMRSCARCKIKKTKLESETSSIDPLTPSTSAGLYANYDSFEGSSLFSSIPKDFVCPLTGMLFEDPVTLETGQTFEQVAIKKWFDHGNKTCPITRQTLECLVMPSTNLVLKRVIDGWKSEHCRNLLLFSNQIAGTWIKHNYKSKDEAALFILEQLLTGFNAGENMENAQHLISLGGLQFLIQKLEFGDMEEKSRVAALLSCCIMANGGCRNYLVRNLKKASVLELLHSKQVKSRTNAVLLLTELICLNRRATISSFLNGLWKEGIMNTMHVLLVYLQSSLPEQRPLIAVLLLQFDLLVEPKRYSIYREEAIDAIAGALDCGLVDEKVCEQSCRALLLLGGRFSFTGEVLMEAWLLKQAGYNGFDADLLDEEDESMRADDNVQWEEEENAREDWSKNLAVLLMSDGKKLFLESISKCLSCRNPDLVRACLVTVAWLSHTLVSLSDNTQLQLTAFTALVPCLKWRLENDGRVENRVLTSLSLLNFSKISECQLLLTRLAKELAAPLRSLAESTWTAKQLHATISRESVAPPSPPSLSIAGATL